MEQVARASAGGPRLLLRALVVCFLAAFWLLLSHVAASADDGDEGRGLGFTQAGHGVGGAVSETARDARTARGDVATQVSDTVATTRDAVDDRGDAVKPIVDAVRDVDAAREVEDTGRRAVEETVRTVRATADSAAGAVRGTTEQVGAVAAEATNQVTEVVETADPVPAPEAERAAPERPVFEARDTRARERSPNATQVHESLVTQENPALLAIPATAADDLVTTAVGAAGSTALAAPSTPEPAPAHTPGHAPGHSSPTNGGSGPLLPTPAQLAYLGGLAPASDLDLVTGALERALVPPAERATSPGTTPD